MPLASSVFFSARARLSAALFPSLAALAACSPAAAPPAGAALAPSPAAAAVHTAPDAGAPASAGPDLALPEVERARIEYALESVALLGHEWPWLQAGETCVLLLTPKVQWILNCPQAPDDFSDVHAPLLDRPVYARSSDTLELNHRQVAVSDFIQALPATVDLPLPGGDSIRGGHEPWILVSSLDALASAHPGFKAGTPSEKWVAVFVHEFFHTRQLSRPDLLPTLQQVKGKGLDTETLEQAFIKDLDYRALVKHERDILANAAAQNDALTATAARRALAEWSAAYEKRRAHLHHLGGDPLVQTDLVLTYVEGTARYVEARFLQDVRFHPSQPLRGDPSFQNYQPYSTKSGYEGLTQTAVDPSYWYCIGMHLGLVLDRAAPDWKMRVIDQPDWLIGLARRIAAESPRAAPEKKPIR